MNTQIIDSWMRTRSMMQLAFNGVDDKTMLRKWIAQLGFSFVVVHFFKLHILSSNRFVLILWVLRWDFHILCVCVCAFKTACRLSTQRLCLERICYYITSDKNNFSYNQHVISDVFFVCACFCVLKLWPFQME